MRTLLKLSCVALLAAVSVGYSADAQTARLGLVMRAKLDHSQKILEAVVTIDQIYLQGGSGDGEGEEEESGRLNLLAAPVTVDLLTLADEWMPLVEGVEIPVGQYGQLRFVVSGAYLRVAQETGDIIYATSANFAGLPDGAEVGGSLQTPGFAQSGLKVSFQGGLAVEGDTTLLVDFDVAESFGHQAGQGWVMHPVLKGSIVEPEEVAARRSR